MDVREILSRIDLERRQLARDGEILDVLPLVTRLRLADGSHHAVIYSALTAETANRAIDQEIEHHRRLAVDFEWKLFAHDPPGDMLRRLASRGLEIGEREVVLVADVHDAVGRVQNVDASAVARIERPEQIDGYRQVTIAVHGASDVSIEGELAAALRSSVGHVRGYVAHADGAPVSAGRMYTHPQSAFAGLYGGATLTAYRGQGFYRALVAVRARDAAALGARYLLVDALPTSRPILERLGFLPITATWPCQWKWRTG